jgi:hypothetical protein
MDLFEYDINGNFYIHKGDEYYILNIDSNDDVYFEKIINPLSKINNSLDSISKNNIIENSNIIENKLHIKTMEDAIKEIDNNNLDDLTQEEIQEIAESYDNFTMNPEFKYYTQKEHDLDDECYDDNEENIFELYDTNNSIKKANILFNSPFFEFIIMSKQNRVLFRTELTNNQPFYRITIFENGNIQLNIIGTKLNYYNINYDTLEIKKDTSQYVNVFKIN